MCSTYEDFSQKIDQIRSQYKTRLENDLKKHRERKEQELSREENDPLNAENLKQHFGKFDQILENRSKEFQLKMNQHSGEYKKKFAELISQREEVKEKNDSVGPKLIKKADETAVQQQSSKSSSTSQVGTKKGKKL